ncbi:O-fucosyltransferase 36, partial [Bienertia sinuspersici]
METFARTKRLVQIRLVQFGDEGKQDEGPQNQEPQDEGQHDDVLEDKGPSNYVKKSPPQRRSKVKQFSKMSRTPLKKFISYGLIEAQKKDIMSIGLWRFLDLDIDEMPSDLCLWLIRHFNHFQSSVKLKNGHLDLGIDDIHIVFGLPKCGNSVQLAGSKETSLEYNELVGVWLEHLGKDRSNVTISDIVCKMKEQEGGGENFKRNFVIMFVSTSIKGNQKGMPNYKLLKCLGDVNSIRSLNWSQFALEPLADCAREWKEADGTYLFTGSILALLFSYIDRVFFLGRVMDRQFPLIKCWKRANIFNRRDLESRKAGEFGTADVKPRLILNVGGEHAFIEKVSQIAKQLAKSFSEFVDAMDEAKLKFPNREPIVKLCDLASSIVRVFEDSEFKEYTQRGVDFSQDDGIANAVRKRKKVGSGDEEVVMHQQPTTIASEERLMKRKSTTREQAAVYCSSELGSGNVDGVMHQKGSTVAAPVRRSPRVVCNSGDNDGVAASDVGHKGFVGVVILEKKQKLLPKRELHCSEYYKSHFIMRNVNILKDENQAEENVVDW